MFSCHIWEKKPIYGKYTKLQAQCGEDNKMQCEGPDTQFFAEIRELNLEFVELLAQARDRGEVSVFGLDSALLDAIRRLGHAQREAIAATPCLLAGFHAGNAGAVALGVAEPLPGHHAQWITAARLFAAGVLGYAWQMARRDRLRAALCAGPVASMLAGKMSFREMRGTAEHALQRLEARFHGRHRFWPDLISAARDGHAGRLDLARLTAIQLAIGELDRRDCYGARAGVHENRLSALR